MHTSPLSRAEPISRFLVLLLLLIGFALSLPYFQGDMVVYSGLNICVISSALYLHVQLSRSPVRAVFPLWAMYFLYIFSYFAKFYFALPIAYGAHREYLSSFYSAVLLDRTTALTSFRICTFSFVIFCVTTTTLLNLLKQQKWPPMRIASTRTSLRVGVGLLVFTMALAATTSIVIEKTGALMMGQAQVELPFHLAGILYYGRIVFVPALLVVVYSVAVQNHYSRLRIVAVLCTAAFGISDLVQRTSKYTFISVCLMLYLTHLIVGWRIPRKYLTIGVSGFLVFLLLQPLFLLYRVNRYRNDIMPAIRMTYEVSEPTDGLGTMFYSGICAAFERMPGIDVVGQLIEADIRPQGLAALQKIGGVSSVVTYDGYGLSPNTANSPSFVGFWYVLGGEMLVYFGTAAFVLGTISFWRWIQGINVCRRWRVGFLIPVITATLLIDLFGEGALDNDMLLRKAAAGIVAVVFAETVLCFGEPRVRKVLCTDG